MKEDPEDLRKEIEVLHTKLEKFKKREKERKNRNWRITKIFGTFITGPPLKSSILKFLKELDDPNQKVSKETYSELTANIVKRLTRPAIIAIFLTLIPICLLFWQNKLINYQNETLSEQSELFQEQTKLFKTQNDKIENQSQLIEASRRSSQTILLGEVLSDITRELESDNNKKRTLSKSLVGRIISLSLVMKPYRYIKDGTLIKNPLSPERGQLLISLIESKIDSAFLVDAILERTDFSHSDLEEAIIKDANLIGTNLSNSDFTDAYIFNSYLNDSDLGYTIFKNARVYNSDMGSSGLVEADFKGATFENVNFARSFLGEVDLRGSFFDNFTTMNGTIFDNVIMDSTTRISTNNGIPRMLFLRVLRKDWLSYVRDSIKLIGAEKICNNYVLSEKLKGKKDFYVLLPKDESNVEPKEWEFSDVEYDSRYLIFSENAKKELIKN